MTTAVMIAPTPILQFLDNQGRPCVGGSVLTQVGGINTATYQDAAGTTPLPNPIRLNSRGEVSDATGVSRQLFLTDSVTYTFTLFDAAGNLLNQAPSVTSSGTAAANILTLLATPGGSALIGFIQIGADAVARTVQSKLRETISITDYGAKCDGSTDDTLAWLACVTDAQALVTGRFLAGVTIFVPRGMTLITSTITITSSNIAIKGESPSSSVIYAPNANFDLFAFDGSSLALYSVGVSNLRFYTPGNATAGAHIRATRCINSDFQNIHYIAHYDALVLDGCAKIHDTDGLRSQENRTSATAGRYALALLGTNFSCSDVTVDGANFIYAAGATDTETTFRIEAVDGLYVGPGHQFGKLSIAPAVNAAFPTGQTVASVKFVGWYFDASLKENIEFVGTSLTYRNFDFVGCNVRTSGNNGVAANGIGLKVNASSPINRLAWIGGDFDGHPLWGINVVSTVVDFSVTGGTRFNNNNTTNSAAGGDAILSGQCTMADARFAGGGALGTAISLTGTATNCVIHHCVLVNSLAANKIVNAGGVTNKINNNAGFVTKNRGQSTITNPATSLTVAHGLAVTPLAGQIMLTESGATDGAGVTRIRLTPAPDATNFYIATNAAPTTTYQFDWQANAET